MLLMKKLKRLQHRRQCDILKEEHKVFLRERRRIMHELVVDSKVILYSTQHKEESSRCVAHTHRYMSEKTLIDHKEYFKKNGLTVSEILEDESGVYIVITI